MSLESEHISEVDLVTSKNHTLKEYYTFLTLTYNGVKINCCMLM